MVINEHDLGCCISHLNNTMCIRRVVTTRVVQFHSITTRVVQFHSIT